jgi:hypothetical protein
MIAVAWFAVRFAGLVPAFKGPAASACSARARPALLTSSRVLERFTHGLRTDTVARTDQNKGKRKEVRGQREKDKGQREKAGEQASGLACSLIASHGA